MRRLLTIALTIAAATACGRLPVGGLSSPSVPPTTAADTVPGVAGGGLDSPPYSAGTPGMHVYVFGLAPGVYKLWQTDSPTHWGDVPSARPSHTRIWYLRIRMDDEGNVSVDTVRYHDPHSRIPGGLALRPMTGATWTTNGTFELRRSW